MNRLTIIGNLTRDPELRTTSTGKEVATFTVAVNRRSKSDHPVADYFRVTAWDGLADIAVKYLAKGKKVCVVGPVRVTAYETNAGTAAASMEVTANELELLSPREQATPTAEAETDFSEVDEDDVPF